MNDLVPGVKIEGEVLYHGQNIFDPAVDVTQLRKKVGMVFQKPNPFPMSIYDNIAYGPRLHGTHSKAELNELVEKSLRGASLWDEVKDRLKKSALGLSGGQQQRLCIARALAVQPDVLLMDEPTSALDPASTIRIEELMAELKKNYTVVIVTHNMQQAARISDKCAFFPAGGDGGDRPHRADLQHAPRQAHRGLHHRPVRLIAARPRRQKRGGCRARANVL